jgi:flagellar hook-basal body complex protein FliE
MSIDNINSVLARMQAMAEMAKGQPTVGNISGLPSLGPVRGDAPTGGVNFGDVLKQAVQQVSDAQHTAQAKAQAFQMGSEEMSLEEVMISLQKANLAFQGMIAVRNKLVEAYQSVTNMQV